MIANSAVPALGHLIRVFTGWPIFRRLGILVHLAPVSKYTNMPSLLLCYLQRQTVQTKMG